jgi:hypothetical protein
VDKNSHQCPAIGQWSQSPEADVPPVSSGNWQVSYRATRIVSHKDMRPVESNLS